MTSLFDGPVLQPRRTEMENIIASEASRAGFLPVDEFGRSSFRVDSVERADDRCIVAIGHYDLRETAREPFDPEELAAIVLHRDPDAPVANDTGWRIFDGARLRLGSDDPRPATLEEASGSDLSPLVDTTCGLEEEA
jgi:hypothetical protein